MRLSRSARLFLAMMLAVLALAVMLSACGGNAQPVIVTEQPTATFTEVTTPTAEVAGVVYVTATPVPTRDPGSSTPGPSPTNPLAPTLSPIPETPTATMEPTLAGLLVLYFTTDSEYVTPGNNVTLFWSVRGADRVRIYRLDDQGARIYRWDVNTEGKITVGTNAGDREATRFLLTAETGGASIEQELVIPLRCPEFWFFEPAPDACPAAPSQVSSQVEQTFERGRMIWVETEARIYVIFEDGLAPGWAQYPDNFAEGDPDRDETLIPPPGMLQPIRGFGLVWRANPRVQERLGWATTQEVPFEGMYQADSAEPSVATVYLRARDGGILALDAQTGEWEVLPPPAQEENSAS